MTSPAGGYELVDYRPGRVARIVMRRPEVRNAQSGLLLWEVDRALAEAAADRDVRVIVLAGEGEAFSAGHDIGTAEQEAYRAEWIARLGETTDVEHRFAYSWEHFVDMSLRWRDIPKPTIAEVHGWCIFGGWLVASSMDVIVAAHDARFLTSLLQYFTLPWEVGPRKAKQLLFDAHQISAQEAHELGFVNEVVPGARLTEETMALAERVARHSPFYLRMAKQAVNGAQEAMGFRAAVLAAHAQYHLSEQSSRQWEHDHPKDPGEGRPRRRLPLVDQILRDEAQGT